MSERIIIECDVEGCKIFRDAANQPNWWLVLMTSRGIVLNKLTAMKETLEMAQTESGIIHVIYHTCSANHAAKKAASLVENHGKQ